MLLLALVYLRMQEFKLGLRILLADVELAEELLILRVFMIDVSWTQAAVLLNLGLLSISPRGEEPISRVSRLRRANSRERRKNNNLYITVNTSIDFISHAHRFT
jgi:hypothetical protein